MFGRSKTWTYRLIYAGILHPLKSMPTLMIPRSEVERLLADTAVYDGRTPEQPSHGASNDEDQNPTPGPACSGRRQRDSQSQNPQHKPK